MSISVNNVTKKFKNHVVLDRISFDCEPGKIYGFVGYNGSGKTVLFKCICGLLKPDSGTIVINGEKMGDQMIRNAGIIIEEPAFIRNETGKKNLEFLYLLNHKRENKIIEEVMVQLGLDPKSKKKVREYSLGMRQRLALAQAIMEKPDIYILDEPMNGLDKKGVDEILQLLLELKNQKKMILLASHNREDISILCDEVFEMEHGRIEKIK